jgi:hypothetical protein
MPQLNHPQLRIALATATAAALTGGLLTFATASASAAGSARTYRADFNGAFGAHLIG